MTAKPEVLDSAPHGWFPLSVMKAGDGRKWDWVALMISVHPEELKNCICDFPALFTVNPDDYRPGSRIAKQCFVRIPGKHRDRDAAYNALENMIATRH